MSEIIKHGRPYRSVFAWKGADSKVVGPPHGEMGRAEGFIFSASD